MAVFENNEKLQTIIEQFDENELKKRAFFNILSHGLGVKEKYIKANKEGIALFAFGLLKSLRDANERTLSEKKYIHLDHDDGSPDPDTNALFISHIEFVPEAGAIAPKKAKRSAIRDMIIPLGCLLVLIILAASATVGFVTIIRWWIMR